MTLLLLPNMAKLDCVERRKKNRGICVNFECPVYLTWPVCDWFFGKNQTSNRFVTGGAYFSQVV
jgi:hypothetical protein